MSGLRFQVSAGFAPLSMDTACRVRNIHDAIFYFGGHGMPCPYKLSSVLCHLLSVICYLYSIHFLPLRQGEYHEVGRGYDVNGKRKTENSSLTFHLSPFFTDPSALRAPPLT